MLENRIGFGPRFGAVILNVILNIVGGVIFGLLFGAELVRSFGSRNEVLVALQGTLGTLVGIGIGTFIFSIINGLLEAFFGSSLGKLVLRIRVGDASGSKASVIKLIGRYFVKNIAIVFSLIAFFVGVQILSKIGGVLGLVVFLGTFAMFSSSKQALHDMLLKTAVYKTKDLK